MSKSLVIVESPGKIKTIQKFLGPNFIIKASIGHIFEIDPSSKSVDKENNFEPEYTIIKGKKTVVDELKKLSKECETTYICSDPDREGEFIGWSIANFGLDKKAKIKRVTFHEITKSAIDKAFANPTDIDMDLVHAQQARAVLDRLVGYNVSPTLWRYVAKNTSAGRVQSIGLKIIVDRQQEIDDFKVEEYWTITGDFNSPKNEIFTANYSTQEKPTNEKNVNEIIDSIKTIKRWSIKEVSKSKKDRMPFPVFQTSTMQQFCSTNFNWNAKRTMNVAQSLYEKGLISYHRTDSVNISKEAIDEVRNIIMEKYGTKYLPSKPVIYKSKENAQEAHEGIRPTHFDMSLDQMQGLTTDEEFKLYEAIYSRFVACQMTKAEFNHTKVIISSDDNKHEFSINGQTMLFDGFMKVYFYSTTKENILPILEEKDIVDLKEIKSEQHFTKPPAQYNDASLIKTLEEKGIGRPSTYASIIETLKKRTYIEETKKAFVPTDLGKRVSTFLSKAFSELMNTNYTARIEEQLDEIANNKKVWNNVVGDFWTELEKQLTTAKGIGKAIKDDNTTDIDCPTCKKNKLVKRFGKFGPFYGCSGYRAKECNAMFKIGENEEPVLIERKEKKYIEGKTCSCGGRIILRTAHKSGKEFGGCEKFPKCKKIYTSDGELIESVK
jgi:DNA topoisomerase I